MARHARAGLLSLVDLLFPLPVRCLNSLDQPACSSSRLLLGYSLLPNCLGRGRIPNRTIRSGVANLSINDRGEVAGTYGTQGFVYDSGVFTTISVQGSWQVAVTDVNAKGEVVGWYRDDTRFHGFEATPPHGRGAPAYITLNALLASGMSQSGTANLLPQTSAQSAPAGATGLFSEPVVSSQSGTFTPLLSQDLLLGPPSV
jgi:hypothetical protein